MKAFLEMYNSLHADNLHRLREVYRRDVRFVDPAHEIDGLDNLVSYFENMYKNVSSIGFTFTEPVFDGTDGYVSWEMTFSHKRLAGGRRLQVDGLTHVRMDGEGMVYFHRDYFDLGAMVYEHVPVLGRIIQTIRKRLGQ
jgi:hypothetical protein